MVRRLYVLSIALLVLYACALAGLFMMQRDLLYPASNRRTTAAEAKLDGVEDLVLPTPDGEPVGTLASTVFRNRMNS